MRLTRRLYQRFRVLIHEAAKFGVVGLAGFIVSLGGADVLRYGLGMGKYKAVVVATVLATVVTFIGNRYWAFRHRERTGMGRETVLFFVFNGIGLLIQLSCVAIVQDGAAPERQGLVQRRQPGRHRAGHAVPLLVVPQVGVADAGAAQRSARQRAPPRSGPRAPGGRSGGGGRRRPGRRGHAVRPRGGDLRRRRGLPGWAAYGGGAEHYGRPEGYAPGTGEHGRAAQ